MRKIVKFFYFLFYKSVVTYRLMRKPDPFKIIPAALVVIFLFPAFTLAQQAEKWVDEKTVQLERADRYAEMLLAGQKHPIRRTPKRKRWTLYGKIGSEFDSNVPLISRYKTFRPGHTDTNAFRFPIRGGISYDLYRTHQARAGVFYSYSYYPHTGKLQSYNFQNHETSFYATRRMQMWRRPAEIGFRYTFAHSVLNAKTYSSGHFGTLSWTGEWANNLVLTVYERIGISNFRDKGFDKSISSRDGLYQQTGIVQTFLFDNRKRSFSIGYELGIDATRGRNFKAVDNGVQLKLKSPLVEKITGEAIFLFQDSYYHNFAVNPKRHDVHFQYELRLSRPINQYLAAAAFYRRTDVITPHKGSLGQFSYGRNVGGLELTYVY